MFTKLNEVDEDSTSEAKEWFSVLESQIARLQEIIRETAERLQELSESFGEQARDLLPLSQTKRWIQQCFKEKGDFLAQQLLLEAAQYFAEQNSDPNTPQYMMVSRKELAEGFSRYAKQLEHSPMEIDVP